MSQENRSKHYDWFKGSSSKDKKKSGKEKAKITWKFTKIFLYFSLFFFSMWGCVQVFIVKTNPAVGRGVELYAGDDKISPAVTSIHIEENANDIYKFSTANDNVFIGDKNHGDVLDGVHAQLKEQGVTSLDQANKGGNLVARLVINGKEINPEHAGVVYGTDGKVLAVSSASTDFSKIATESFTLATYTKDQAGAIQPTPYAVPTITGKNVLYYAYNTQIVAALLKADPKLAAFVASTPTTDEQIASHNNVVNSIYGILGVEYKNNAWIFHNSPFGGFDKTYRPISTWGQAWQMDKGGGPFFGIFVYPISWVTNKITNAMPMMSGWESLIAIVLVVVAVSIITFLLSFKGTLQQTKMQEMNAKKAVIDAKYAPYKGNKQMEMRQRQEVSELYKKEGINPMSSMASIFITMPFFLAMWRVIGSIQHIKGTTWLGINFAATSYKELFSGHFQYLPLMLIAAGIQIFSQIYPRLLTKRRDKNRINIHQKAAMKKGNKMQNIMLVVFAFMALIFSAGLQIYFIVRSLWRLAEVQITHHIIMGQRKRRLRVATK